MKKTIILLAVIFIAGFVLADPNEPNDPNIVEPNEPVNVYDVNSLRETTATETKAMQLNGRILQGVMDRALLSEVRRAKVKLAREITAENTITELEAIKK